MQKVEMVKQLIGVLEAQLNLDVGKAELYLYYVVYPRSLVKEAF